MLHPVSPKPFIFSELFLIYFSVSKASHCGFYPFYPSLPSCACLSEAMPTRISRGRSKANAMEDFPKAPTRSVMHSSFNVLTVAFLPPLPPKAICFSKQSSDTLLIIVQLLLCLLATIKIDGDFHCREKGCADVHWGLNITHNGPDSSLM